MLTFWCIYAILAIGLNIIWGYTGLINIGYVAFFAIGAYSSAILTTGGHGFLTGLLVGMVLAGLAGLLVGIPTLRLRADYLAIVTLGFAEILRLLLLNETWLTRGPFGIPGIPQPLRGLFQESYSTFYLALALAALATVYLFSERLVRSPFGRVLKAIREDEDVASALGKNVFRYKLQSLVLGSVTAGAAGTLFAHFITFVSPEQYESIQTFYVWIMVVLGGSGSNRGALLGALILIAFFEGTRFLKDFLLLPLTPDRIAAARLILVGLLLIILMLYRPQGVFGERYAAR
ncbi:MAG: branched-chain amino acid ABC transporter permease [Methanobacteriota archaeon]|nr:MAG: branched-chain amino acid ABC transporter permease [Euryarchaeota archaeon]